MNKNTKYGLVLHSYKGRYYYITHNRQFTFHLNIDIKQA